MTRQHSLFYRMAWAKGLAAAALGLLLSACVEPKDEFPVLDGAIRFQIAGLGDWQGKTPTKATAPQPGSPLRLQEAASDASSRTDRAPRLAPAPVPEYRGVRFAESVLFEGSTGEGTGEDSLFLHSRVAERELKWLPPTKAAPVGLANFYPSFGVHAALYNGAWDEAACRPNYFYNAEVTASSGWATSYPWPKTPSSLRFFAYAPFNAAGVTLSGAEALGTPALDYVVPAQVAQQQDLLVAATDGLPCQAAQVVTLHFTHALTAVKFVVGEAMPLFRITQVSLKNVYSTGHLVFGAENWTEQSVPATFTQVFEEPVTTMPGAEIAGGATTFMMLPQTLPTGAVVEVVRTNADGTNPTTLTASIAGAVWRPGKQVSYKISISGSDMEIEPLFEVKGPEVSYRGGEFEFQVESYGVDPEDNKHPLPWTAQIVADDGETPLSAPLWVPTFGTDGAAQYTGTGSTSEPQTFPLTIAEQTPDIDHPDPFQPGAVPPVTDYDLSTKGGRIPQSTANCYIVTAPGSYKLPLVYGNAIKDGLPNPGAYISTAVPATYDTPVLQVFLNHLGNEITDPYIYNNTDCTPAGATLIWQDAPNLINNVGLSADGHYLTFEVDDNYFCQANAVVSVLDAAGNVMWSWHLWFTIYSPSGDIKVRNQDGEEYTFMTVNMGWCGYGTISMYYQARSFKVKFTQVGTDLTQVVTVRQEPYADLGKTGNSVYYQMGRSTPLPGATETVLSGNFVNKTLYYSDPKYTEQYTSGNSVSIKDAIQNPYKFYNFNGTRWNVTDYINLWDISQNMKTPSTGSNFWANSIKSVYDPCPLGYKVPPIKAFFGFTVDQKNYGAGTNLSYPTISYVGSSRKVNNLIVNNATDATAAAEIKAEKGYTFYCYPMNPTTRESDTSGGTIWFYAAKFRQGSGGTIPNNANNYNYGHYWSSTQHTGSEAYTLMLNIGEYGTAVAPQNRYKIGSAYGHCIRAVRDE